MQSGAIQLMKNNFDALSQRIPDEDIMKPLGYARWENFQTAINRAIESCKTTGYAADDHFRGVTKMVKLGSSAERPIEYFTQMQYAHHLIVQNILARQGREAWPDAATVQEAVGQLPSGTFFDQTRETTTANPDYSQASICCS